MKPSASEKARSPSLPLAGRRILIAGAAGFLGQALSRHLLNRGGSVVRLVRSREPGTAGLETLVWSDAQKAPWRKNRFTDLIIATGAHRHPVGDQTPELLFNANVAAPFRLAGWAVETGVQRIVYVSSGSVYAAIPQTRNAAGPADLYAHAKLAAERLLRGMQGPHHLQILRLFRPYGPGPARSLVNRVLARVRRGEKIRLAAPDGPRIQPVFVEDVCRIIAALLLRRQSLTLDVAGRERLSLGALIRRWAALAGRVPRCEIVSGRAEDDRRVETSGLAAADALITTALDQGLQIMRSWFNSVGDESARPE